MTIPLLLLPGMMCDARLFAPQIAVLDRDRPVLCPLPVGAPSMAALATRLLLDAPARFALAGLSMGGILAMEVLRQAPERIAGLALMDTNPLAEAEAVRARRAPQIAAAEAGELRRVLHEEMFPNYLAAATPGEEILALCMEMAMDLGPRSFVSQSLALRDRPDQTAVLRGYDGPALVLNGREDRLCPLERHLLMHGLMPQSQHVVIENAGHLPTLEQPEETTAALCRWLETI